MQAHSRIREGLSIHFAHTKSWVNKDSLVGNILSTGCFSQGQRPSKWACAWFKRMSRSQSVLS